MANANGDLYRANGTYLHRLDPDCTSMQPLLFPDTGELVVDDIVTHLDVVVVDFGTGEEVGRISTGRRVLGSGTFFTPGTRRDLSMCDVAGYTLIWVREERVDR